MRGKQKCKILKEIRQRIADENDIPYVTRECRFQGDCTGTCPRCESELRYLEQQLARRAALGKRVTVAALCAGIALAGTGCSPSALPGQKPPQEELSGAVAISEPDSEPDVFVTEGEVPYSEAESASLSSDSEIYELEGDVPYSEPEIVELSGEAALPGEE